MTPEAAGGSVRALMKPEPATTVGERACQAAEHAERYCERRLEEYVRRLEELVGIDSGPDDRAGRDLVATVLGGWARRAGLTVELLDRPAGLFLRASLAGEAPGRVIMLGHHDTVYAGGTAGKRPLTLRDGIAHGPGTADMKGGLLIALTALEALRSWGSPLPTIELHSVPDEEVRKTPFPTMDLVRGADAVLVFECGRESGNVVAHRKTGAWLRLGATGRSAHAGTEPERGRNAALAICREALRCAALSCGRPGLTVTLTRLEAGALPNVVPADAAAVFDVRAQRRADLEWVRRQMGVGNAAADVRFELQELARWPGIEPTPAGDRLLMAARALAERLGRALDGETSGGMSDGCWTAAEGIPTLDGLGPIGGDDHSPEEHIDLRSVAWRCGIAAGLAVAVGDVRLTGPPPASPPG